jgi:hypothetical protein
MRLKIAVKYNIKHNNVYTKLIVAVVTLLKPQIHLYSAE